MKVRNGSTSIGLERGHAGGWSALGGLAVALTLLTAACGDSPTQLVVDRTVAPEASQSAPELAGSTTVLDEPFDLLDSGLWLKGAHTLGLSQLEPDNVAVSGGNLVLATPAGGYTGGEIYSTSRYQYGIYSASMRCVTPAGTVCAFFLYQGVPGNKNDEIDIELLPGSNEVMLTTWVQGRSTNHARFVAAWKVADYHTYTIEYRSNAVAFSVDGSVLKRYTRKLPSRAMLLMANAWWPTWLSGDPSIGGSFLIDRITVQS